MTNEETLLGGGSILSSTHKAEDILPKNEIGSRIARLQTQTFYHGDSYFPEQNSKNKEERQKDLERQVKLFGYPDFNYLLYGMDVKTQEEQDKYVNAWEFICRRNFLNMHRNIHNSTCILRNKFYFGIFATAIGIKTPKNVAYIENGVISDITNGFKAASLADILTKSPDVFCKSMDGENGVGVFHVEYKEGIIINGKQADETEFWNVIGNGTFLIQERIIQHPEMSRIYPTSINTLRIDTVRNLKTGEINLWPSMMRMGAFGSHIDNASQGGIMVNIDLVTGKLDEYGYRESHFDGGGIFYEHPNTKVKFNSFEVPFFKESVEKCVFFHSMLKDIHSIGWDVVITPDGPSFIEGNDDWEILDAQLAGGVRDLYERDFFD